MAELHERFNINEAVTCEELKFGPKGKVKKGIESGFFNVDEVLPV